MKNEIPDPIAVAIGSAHIPPLPQALLRVLRMVDDDAATPRDLARAIEQDPGLCARLLTAANSPALRRGAELASVESCVVALGTRLIRSIATCLAVRNTFERAGASPRLDLAAFWLHSLEVAEMSRSLAAADHYPQPDMAYLSGLLHDVGILAILSAMGDKYAELLEVCGGEARLGGFERQLFGVDHCEVAAWLIDRWQIDESFADGVLFHHADAAAIENAGRLPQIVWLAHALVGDANAPATLGVAAQRIFGATIAERLGPLRDECRRAVRAVAEAVGVALPAAGDDPAVADTLPHLGARPARSPAAAAEDELTARIGGMAALQPLQSEFLGLESHADLWLSLREAARILFDLHQTAVLLADRATGILSGSSLRQQPAVFRDEGIEPHERRCLAALAVDTGSICCSFERSETPTLLDRRHARALDSDGLLCVPLAARRRSIGVLVFGIDRGQFARLGPRLPWLHKFARIAAISLEGLQDSAQVAQAAAATAAARHEQQARRLAHEAGNPIGIIKGYLRLLDGRLQADPGMREELTVLREEIDRVAAIIQRLGEPPPPSAAPASDLAALLRELLLLYREPLFTARGITVDADLGSDSCPVACDRDAVKQIVINLWKNAAEAMPDGGRLRLVLAPPAPRDGRILAELRIEDSGPGIATAQALKLGHPDFVAAAGSRGLGLGIVATLAARAGIEVECSGRDGVGTELRLRFPVAP